MRAREEDGLTGAKTRDSAIKLFGRTIPFPATPMEVKDPCSDFTKPEQAKSSALKGEGENRHVMAVNNPETNLQNNKENGVDAKEDEKISKKPAKAVPCPRCNSYETKFCYFNNYNVNQPRHFCKNCHRYWTAGGTMRNVPVGAGKRRNKPSASQFCSASDSANHPFISAVEPSTSSVTLLKFRPEKTLCKSMDSAIDEPSTTTSGSSTITPTNVINDFSEMVMMGEGYFVKKKWCSENGNGNGSGVLGKHCRDEKLAEEDELERCLSVPKTLRVDDPKDSNLGFFRL